MAEKILRKSNEDKQVKTENIYKIIPNSKFLEAGVYFGHRTQQWNPKMKKFIHSKRRGIHILDVSKTSKALEWAYKIINAAAAKGATFIFVGTKKHAKEIVKEQAQRTNSYYVTERWLGGTLTNSKTIFSRVRRLFDLEKMAENNFEGYTKKEGIEFKKELSKLQKNFEGIREMKTQPNFMIVVDPNVDRIAVKEARDKGVKIIGILDSDANPDFVDLGIPANDDSIKSISLILTVLADAIVNAKGGKDLFAYQDEANIILPEDKKIDSPQRSHFNNTRFDQSSSREHRDSWRRNSQNTSQNQEQSQRPYKRTYNKDSRETLDKKTKEEVK
ncbi:30S ribosomal protein S2 [Mycoplasmopsis pulmonis]|uniref:30S ribosomal protein S2 n=1 Tax=Mycoplasmopsis pulmonis TaxID=2107 RepID=UPI0010050045|nr:30S ribosomal protein S2 [Mycoplasmopsis pulmonis]VEU68298.1 Vegetative protein 209 [Mycoplasmopsis pulmonis]